MPAEFTVRENPLEDNSKTHDVVFGDAEIYNAVDELDAHAVTAALNAALRATAKNPAIVDPIRMTC